MFAPEESRLRLWRSVSSFGAMDLSVSASWQAQETLAASSVDLSTDSAYASSPSIESEAPRFIAKSSSVKSADSCRTVASVDSKDLTDSLDENATFNERLI